MFEDKGHFSLHDDARSQAEAVFDWRREEDDGFGLRGFGPGNVDIWWEARVSERLLERAGESKVRPSRRFADEMLARVTIRAN
jgi:hypothetical protein